MKDLYTNVILQISNVEAIELYSKSGVPGGFGIAPVKRDKIFVPSDDMSMTELAEVFAVYINISLSGQALTPDEYNELPETVRKFFRDI